MRGGYEQFVMFEMNQVYRRSDGVDEDNVPNGRYELATILLDENTKSNYYLAKKYLEDLLESFEIEFEITEFAEEKDKSNAYYEPKRSAKITSGEVVLGYLGEFKAGVLQSFKLPLGTAGFELDIDRMLELAGKAKKDILRFSQFPSVGRDLTLTVDAKQDYASVERALRAVFEKKGYIYKLSPASIYQGEGQTTKNLSFHFEFSDPNKTLSKDDIQGIMVELEKVKF